MVNYHVISADGHAVQGSYPFSVGALKQAYDFLAGKKTINDHSHGSFGLWLSRFLYYLSLLTVTGWIFWGNVFRYRLEEISKEYHLWLNYSKHLFLLMVLGMGFVQLASLLSGLDVQAFIILLFSTPIGLSWFSSFILALAGYFVLRRNKWVDYLWILYLGRIVKTIKSTTLFFPSGRDSFDFFVLYKYSISRAANIPISKPLESRG